MLCVGPVRFGHRLVSIAVVLAVLGERGDAHAAGNDRGILRVEFLYAVEHAGGRGERLREPVDIFLDRKTGELYVVDAAAAEILVYDRNGMFVQAIEVGGAAGAPRMVAVDGLGRIYVAHLTSGKISLLDYRGEVLDALTLPGVVDVPGAPVRPVAFAVGAAGEVYALKSAGGIVRVDPDGDAHEEIPIAGGEKPNLIYGIAVDRTGRFLFTDMRPYSVVTFDPKSGDSKRFGSAGVLYGQLDRPIGIAADDAGRIFVVSTVTNKVSCFGRDGEFIEEFGQIGEGYGRFYMPSKIVSDGRDRVYVLENTLKRVQVFRVQVLEEKEKTRASQGSVRGDRS